MSKTVNLDLAPEYYKPLLVLGASRDAENHKGLYLYMSREYSDEELRRLHEAMKRAAMQVEEEGP